MTTPQRHSKLVMESQNRHIEKHRARHAVSKKVKAGLLPSPASLQCVDCNSLAECYDHPRGYNGKARFDVEPVCWKCHLNRGKVRKEYKNGFTIDK
jgi:hypothetical protein